MFLFCKICSLKGAMALADTILVVESGVELLTKAPKDGLQYDLEDKEDPNEAKAVKPEDGEKSGSFCCFANVFFCKVELDGKRKSRMRDATAVTNELELKERQKENYERLQREIARRAEEGEDPASAAVGE